MPVKKLWFTFIILISSSALLVYLAQFNLNIPNIGNVKGTSANELYIAEVVDGDTVKLNTGETVRYIGVDTPETYGKQECYGKEAKEYNKKLVLNKNVKLVKDTSDKDRYGRLLRYVYIEDTFINAELVKNGYAEAKEYKPDIKYSQQLEIYEEMAKINKKGMWGNCN